MSLICIALLAAVAVSSEILSQESLAVTIYNDDFAIVKDTRQIKFNAGESSLYFTDVAENIQTETVTFKAIEKPDSIRVYEQNYEANTINQDAVMKKYLEKKVDVVADFGDQPKKVSGILLAYSPNIILKTDNGVIIVNKISAIDLPQIPEGFFIVPTLGWKVYSKQAQTAKCEVAYRTTGFRWKADYTVTLSSDEKKADVGGWVTIDNNSGKKYVDAKLKLIAGDVNVVQPSPITTIAMPAMAFMQKDAAEGAPSFSEKSFADYHMYTLSKPVTLNQSSQKQVEFIPKVFNVTVRRYNEISISSGGRSQQNIEASSKVSIRNVKQVGLGIPFPKGTVRVFKQDDADKSLQFIGQDSIQHTPKDQNITLTIGKSFDIRTDLIAENRRSFSSNGYSADMKLTINNHKDTPSEIEIKFSTSYGDNLKVTWDAQSKANWFKKSSEQSILVVVLGGNEKREISWSENYQP